VVLKMAISSLLAGKLAKERIPKKGEIKVRWGNPHGRKIRRYKIITCETCGKTIHRFDRTKYPKMHVPKEKILSAIRRHYKKHHPKKFRAFIKKGAEKRKRIYKRGKKAMGKRRKRRKWGKIGAPKSAKRRRWLAKIRRKRR